MTAERQGTRAFRPIEDAPSESVTGHEDDDPQAVTYMEALLEGANPDEGFYE